MRRLNTDKQLDSEKKVRATGTTTTKKTFLFSYFKVVYIGVFFSSFRAFECSILKLCTILCKSFYLAKLQETNLGARSGEMALGSSAHQDSK